MNVEVPERDYGPGVHPVQDVRDKTVRSTMRYTSPSPSRVVILGFELSNARSGTLGLLRWRGLGLVTVVGRRVGRYGHRGSYQ